MRSNGFEGRRVSKLSRNNQLNLGFYHFAKLVFRNAFLKCEQVLFLHPVSLIHNLAPAVL